MINTIAPAVIQFAMPALRQGARDGIRIMSASVTLIAGVAAVSVIAGVGSAIGSAAYRGTRKAYNWAREARMPILAIPAGPVSEPTT
jgi:hypothetical protein